MIFITCWDFLGLALCFFKLRCKWWPTDNVLPSPPSKRLGFRWRQGMLSPKASVMETLQMFQNPTVSMCISITLLPFCPSPVKDDLDRLREKCHQLLLSQKTAPSPSVFSKCMKELVCGYQNCISNLSSQAASYEEDVTPPPWQTSTQY